MTMIAEPSPTPEISVEAPAPEAPVKKERLVSLDALRGFDMFWIIGGEWIIKALAPLVHHPWMKVVDEQFEHVTWRGFHAYDLIFPMFVFIVGVSMVFSLGKVIQTQGRGAAIRKVLIRSAILYALGIFFYGGFNGAFSHIRLMGVLQRIALAYLGAGLLFCCLRARWLAPSAVVLLGVYWALMSFVKAPDEPAVSFEEGHNLANWIDAHYLPLRKWDGNHDPEGLLSTIPAIGSCLLGVLAGLLMKERRIHPYGKVAILLLAGAASVYLGFLWGRQFPVIKKLWTSSFVLVAAGYSSMLLGLFYLVIDVWGLRILASPFVWIGMNPITLYVLIEGNIIDLKAVAERFVGGELGARLLRQFEPLAISIVGVTLMLLLARLLYKRGVFLKV